MKTYNKATGIFNFLTRFVSSEKTRALMDGTVAIEDSSQTYPLEEPGSQNSQVTVVPILSNIPEKGLVSLMEKAKTIRYLKKATLDSERFMADTLLIVFFGEVRVVRGDVNKYKEVTVQVQEMRSGFGKIALLTEEMRSACAVTLEKAVFTIILKSDFKSWRKNFPGLISEFL